MHVTCHLRTAHESKFSHELVAGAASFEAMRAYEQHEAREGKPANHALAKELLVGFAGAEVGECGWYISGDEDLLLTHVSFPPSHRQALRDQGS